MSNEAANNSPSAGRTPAEERESTTSQDRSGAGWHVLHEIAFSATRRPLAWDIGKDASDEDIAVLHAECERREKQFDAVAPYDSTALEALIHEWAKIDRDHA